MGRELSCQHLPAAVMRSELGYQHLSAAVRMALSCQNSPAVVRSAAIQNCGLVADQHVAVLTGDDVLGCVDNEVHVHTCVST